MVTNSGKKWIRALAALRKHQQEIDREFAECGFRRPLAWDQIGANRWVVPYGVDVSHEGKPDPAKLRELNEAAAAMKRTFDPYVDKLDDALEDDSESES